MSLKCRVEVGAEYLDHAEPDWFTKIQMEILSLDKGESCILGQLFNGYSDGCDELILDDIKAAAFGFHLTFDPDDPDHNADKFRKEWKELTGLWKKEIKKRKVKKERGKARTHRQMAKDLR